MKKTINLLLLFNMLFILGLNSCDNKSNKIKPVKEVQINSTEDIEDNVRQDDEITDNYADDIFPQTGRSAQDFISRPDIYEIQHQTHGDLNEDGLLDVVFVRVEKATQTAMRTMVILLQNKDMTYRLDKISKKAMPIEFADNGYKIYDTEYITIDNGTLIIQLYATGPNGNLFSSFKYYGTDLVLKHIETYNMGAGSHQALNYNLLTGELSQEVINTMNVEMSSESIIIKLKKRKYLFEDTSPNDLIEEAYLKIGGNY